MQMRGFPIGVLPGLVACLSLSAPANARDEPLSTRQMQAMSSAQVDRTVRQDLLSILEPVKRLGRGNRISLNDVYFRTRPVGSPFMGVCQRDFVMLHYARIGDSTPSRHSPVAPYGIETAPQFHIVTIPGDADPDVGEEKHVWQAACQRLSDKSSWIDAEDAFDAAQGAAVFRQAVADVRSGNLKPEPCPYIYPGTKTCEETILAVGSLEDIGAIETCPAEQGTLCYVFDLAPRPK